MAPSEDALLDDRGAQKAERGVEGELVKLIKRVSQALSYIVQRHCDGTGINQCSRLLLDHVTAIQYRWNTKQVYRVQVLAVRRITN